MPTSPPLAAPGYQLPSVVNDPSEAAGLALQMENDAAVAELLARFDDFRVVPGADVPARAGLSHLSEALLFTSHGLQMTPLRTGTDGFFVAVLERRG